MDSLGTNVVNFEERLNAKRETLVSFLEKTLNQLKDGDVAMTSMLVITEMEGTVRLDAYNVDKWQAIGTLDTTKLLCQLSMVDDD